MTLTDYDDFRGFTVTDDDFDHWADVIGGGTDEPEEEEQQDPDQPAFIELLKHVHDENVDWTWHAKGLCKDADTRLFFPESETSAEADEAKQLCKRCPVQYECLEHALKWPEEYGIWGGLTAAERERIRRQRRGLHIPPHGTARCYWMGCRRPECREAHNAYKNEQRRRKREAS